MISLEQKLQEKRKLRLDEVAEILGSSVATTVKYIEGSGIEPEVVKVSDKRKKLFFQPEQVQKLMDYKAEHGREYRKRVVEPNPQFLIENRKIEMMRKINLRLTSIAISLHRIATKNGSDVSPELVKQFSEQEQG